MPRQWIKSATMPETAAPRRLPEMVAVSSRPIITWRCASGTKSEISAMPTGKLPPQAAPARMRSTNSSQKSFTTAERNDDTVSRAGTQSSSATCRRRPPSARAPAAPAHRRRRPPPAAPPSLSRSTNPPRSAAPPDRWRARSAPRLKIRKLTMLSVRFMSGPPAQQSGSRRTPTASTTNAPNKIVGSAPAMGKAEAIHHRPDRLAEIERR